MIKGVQLFEDQGGNQLEFCVYGSGNLYLFCFPGFGESYEVFENLSNQLQDYTIVGVNLFFVGRSRRVSSSKYLEHEEWAASFGELLVGLNIDRFSVLGFSLGGRFAISTFSAFEEKMDHLILVAADGIIPRRTYELATYPIGCQQLFYGLMKRPSFFFIVLDILKVVGLLNSFTYKFAQSQLKHESARMRVYNSWVTFKLMRLPRLELIKRLNNSSCHSAIVFGEKDKIISPKKHWNFLNQLSKTSINILPFGHNKLVDNSIEVIKKHL